MGVDVPRLVGLVESAIRSTAGSMILDIHIEDELLEAITATITEEIGWGNDADRAMKSALEKVFSHHEERMIDAARDDVNGGKARALRSLPNSILSQRQPE